MIVDCFLFVKISLQMYSDRKFKFCLFFVYNIKFTIACNRIFTLQMLATTNLEFIGFLYVKVNLLINSNCKFTVRFFFVYNIQFTIACNCKFTLCWYFLFKVYSLQMLATANLNLVCFLFVKVN